MAGEAHAIYSSYTYLVFLNLYTFGIELCSSASFSYLPPLLLEMGFSETVMCIIMALGPFFAMVVMPCLGTASDQCTTLPTLLFAYDPPITGQELNPDASTSIPSSTDYQVNTYFKQNGKATGSVPASLGNNSLRHDQIPPVVLSPNPPSISINMPAVVTLGTPISIGQRHVILQIAYQFINVPLSFVCTCVYFIIPRSYKMYLSDTVHSLRTMPLVLRQLCVVNLLTCMAVMGFKLYFVDYVGEALYHGNPDSPLNSLPRISYENGIRMASLGLLFQSITSAMFSFVLNHLVLSYGIISTFLFGMLSFTIMTGLMLVVEDISLTLLLAAFTGFASAAINALPCTLLSIYHQNQEKYYSDTEMKATEPRGIGSDMALLDSAYVLSEVLSSFLFGIAVEITGTTLSYMFCCCVCSVLGSYYILQLKC
ncbi:solute carrier family 45 member 3-like isoform X2 [Acanthaster planci]|uniref:Solute carrier family 45 member 3-like isoform X2 n=1 Tax=Acanthaster planci TaxID=133434 RepID=A0A8B7XSE4_ACAPL|nr:solute carrier family 45 member 3-like isoform X2 [Acanthaster planci]